MSVVLTRSEDFCRRFGLRVPILLAPMAGACPPSLSIAVARAGGLGAAGALLWTPDEIVTWARDVRAGCNGGFQLNLWIPDAPPIRDHANEERIRTFLADWGPAVAPEAADASPPDFTAQCEALIASGAPIVSSIMGVFSPDFVAALKARGVSWFATVTTVAEARAAVIAGADVIVAQGAEAGGHRGAFDPADAVRRQVGLFSLLPAVVDAVAIPVVAAGGIADGRGIAAALALGASAVQIGTGFLRSPEAKTNAAWADAIADTAPEQTMVTRAFSGRAGRSIATRYVEAAAADTAPAPGALSGSARSYGRDADQGGSRPGYRSDAGLGRAIGRLGPSRAGRDAGCTVVGRGQGDSRMTATRTSEGRLASRPSSMLRGDARAVEWRVTDDLTSYETAIATMEARAEAIARGDADELVWLVEHPPLYTAGTSAPDADGNAVPFPLYRTGRGGQVTYHGPGQRVAYVMLDLNARRPDLRAFVGALESWIIGTLEAFAVRGERRDDRVGVWVVRRDKQRGFDGAVAEDKIAAIGIRVRRWVTFHGISLNVDPDLAHYAAITPCGIADEHFGVTSLIDLGHLVPMPEVDGALRAAFEVTFGPTRDASAGSP